MAVYKPTYCYPYLNTIDTRTVAIIEDDTIVPQTQYLSCKVDTSNSTITGYSIRLLDENNKQIFPASTEYISPVTELRIPELGYDIVGTNSGLNGTQLKIPFFQNYTDPLITPLSRNAIYYTPRYLVDHLIMDSHIAALFNYAYSEQENVVKWTPTTADGVPCLRYTWSTETVRNIITLDGETLIEGETVLVAVGTQTEPGTAYQPRSGLWRVAQYDFGDGTEIILIKVTNYDPLDSGSCRLNDNEMATLAKGKTLHNCVLQYRYQSSTSGYFQIPASTQPLWQDADGNAVSLQVDGRTLKWEVILYQGNYNNHSTVSGAIVYDAIEEKYLDITLNSGTILGSTPNRVQIASADPAQYNGEIYLPSSASGTMVLQDNYMAVEYIDPTRPASDRQRIFTANRIYVRSYDATYGHVYPRDGELDANTLGNATHCQFFKRSNDPDMILDSDIVTWGVSNYLRLYVGGTSSTSAYIALDDRDGYTWPYNFQDGDLILLTGQGNPTASDSAATYGSWVFNPGDTSIAHYGAWPFENGVYIYYESATGQSINEGTASEHTFHSFLKRAPSYSSWAPYIGKILYCARGDFEGMNVESLASAGTYTLWDPRAEISGSSSLLFSHERPIQLFPQLLATNRTFKLYCTQNWPASAIITVSGNLPLIDYQTVTVGDTVLFKDGYSATVTGFTVNSTTTTITFDFNGGVEQVQEGEYIYITMGQDCGKQVYLWGNTGIDPSAPNWDLYTGTILKNSPGLTYISPYINMEPGMMLKLLNSKMVTFNGTNIGVALPPTYQRINDTFGLTTTSWIKVIQYNSTLNYITHALLNCASDGLDTQLGQMRSDGLYGLASYALNDEIPWKYEIRSFFMKSIENGFYVFEEPYVRLSRDGFSYSNLQIAVTYDFDVLQAIQSTIYEDLYVQPSTAGGATEEFQFIYYIDQSTISARSVYFSADYVQFNQISWESYRWILFDDQGNVLQDTGNRYEGIIDVSFYGLSNTTNVNQTYYVAVLITDEKNNTLCSVVRLVAAPNQGEAVVGITTAFTAVFDSQTHSVLLDVTVQALDVADPSNSNITSYSFYRREYDIYEKPWKKFRGYLNSGDHMFYQDSNYTTLLPTIPGCLYIDQTNHQDYAYEWVYDITEQAYQYNLTPMYREYIGVWEPVLLKTTETSFRDYNVTSGHSYQYIVFFNTDDIDEQQQLFANYTGKIFVPDANPTEHPGQGKIQSHGDNNTSFKTGEPVKVCWDEWSIVELIPENNTVDAPILKKSYKANLDQLWLLKFSLETGSQTQNISRSEIQTLGQYPRIGFGKLNYISGEVTALLGSEIIPYSNIRYIERLGEARVAPLSTNEKVTMLAQWRKLINSKNPKLLRDIKGQAWIIQIFSGSNKPQNFYKNQPDTISFQWKQIGDLNNVVVYGEGGYQEFEANEGSPVWNSIFH